MKTTSTDQSSNTNQNDIDDDDDTTFSSMPSTGINISNISNTGLYSGSTITHSPGSGYTINTLYDGSTWNISEPTAPKPTIYEVNEKLEKIEKMIGVLLNEPSQETLDKHAALKDAYNKYKMIENMVLRSEKE